MSPNDAAIEALVVALVELDQRDPDECRKKLFCIVSALELYESVKKMNALRKEKQNKLS